MFYEGDRLYIVYTQECERGHDYGRCIIKSATFDKQLALFWRSAAIVLFSRSPSPLAGARLAALSAAAAQQEFKKSIYVYASYRYPLLPCHLSYGRV